MFERFHEFMETALLQKRICKVKKRIRWNNYSFPLSTQCQVKAFFSRSAWEIVFESKLANIPDIEVYQTKNQLAVIFNKVTFNEDGVVVLALSS